MYKKHLISKFRSFQFVRHGETDWNKKYIFQGHHDIPLNKLGVLQAEERAKNISLKGLSQIFVSPLVRARHTAEIINELNGAKLEIVEIPNLMECKSEEGARHILELKGIQEMPSFEKISNFSESKDEFFKRVYQGLVHVMGSSIDARPLIVAHGGVCAAFCHLFKIDFFGTPNCCLVDFQFDGENFSAEVKT